MKLITISITIIAAIIVVLVAALLGAIVTMFAWNYSLADMGIAGLVPHIGFWQAFWLNVLGGMLCSRSSKG